MVRISTAVWVCKDSDIVLHKSTSMMSSLQVWGTGPGCFGPKQFRPNGTKLFWAKTSGSLGHCSGFHVLWCILVSHRDVIRELHLSLERPTTKAVSCVCQVPAMPVSSTCHVSVKYLPCQYQVPAMPVSSTCHASVKYLPCQCQVPAMPVSSTCHASVKYLPCQCQVPAMPVSSTCHASVKYLPCQCHCPPGCRLSLQARSCHPCC